MADGVPSRAAASAQSEAAAPSAANAVSHNHNQPHHLQGAAPTTGTSPGASSGGPLATPNIPGQTVTTTPKPPLSPTSNALTQAQSQSQPHQPSQSPSKQSSSSHSSGKVSSARRVGKYALGKTLGQGTFGKVKFATDTETGRHVAIKMMDKAKIRASNMGEQIKKEISIMKMIKHDSVIQLLEVLASQTTIYIVLELVTGGELFDKIISEGKFSEDEARKYFRQLIDGIAHCHARGVCHRDLKPENLLLDADGHLKISDFGLSALSSDMQGDLLHTTCGTPNYVAPEVLMDKGYDGKAADVWSSGVILYVLLCGFLPFDESSMVELFRKIVKADFAYPADLSHEAVSLLSIILNPDPEKRATIEQIKKHPWYRGKTFEETRREEEEMERQRQLHAVDGNFPASASFSTSSSHNPGSLDSSMSALPPSSSDVSNAFYWVGGKTDPSSSPQRHQRNLSGGSGGVHPATPMKDLNLSPNSSPILRGQGAPSDHAPPSPLHAMGQRRVVASVNKENGSADVRTSPMPLSDMDPLALDDEEADIRGPVALNAFDLINMVGGAAMGRMFQRAAEKKQRTFTQFTASMPMDQILKKLEEVLSSINECAFRIYPKSCIIKASCSMARGKVLGACQIYQMTPNLFMIEWRKLRGDVFLFHDFFRTVKRRFLGQPDPSPTSSPGLGYGSDDDIDDDDVMNRTRGRSLMMNEKDVQAAIARTQQKK